MATRRRPSRPPRRGAQALRSSPSGTSGCTSRGMGAYDDQDVPIIVRGEGCYV